MCWGWGVGEPAEDAEAQQLDGHPALRFAGPYSSVVSRAGMGFCAVTISGEGECRELWPPFARAAAQFEDAPTRAASAAIEDAPVRYSGIGASASHACALTDAGRAVCVSDPRWEDWEGTLTVMHPPDPAPARYTAIGVGFDHACALTDSGEAVCWDAVPNKTAPPDPPPGRYVAVSDGPFHTCALTDAGEAACWGWNNHGQADVPAGRYTAISAGAFHTCAIAESAEAVCWG